MEWRRSAIQITSLHVLVLTLVPEYIECLSTQMIYAHADLCHIAVPSDTVGSVGPQAWYCRAVKVVAAAIGQP
jgi:hypothetical protein